MVEGKGQLHAFDGAWASVHAHCPGALLLGGVLADDVGLVFVLEARSLELLGTATYTCKGGMGEESGWREKGSGSRVSGGRGRGR